MRFIYIASECGKLSGGVFKKIVHQVKSMELLGVQSELLLICRDLPKNLPSDINVRFKKGIVAPFKNKMEKLLSAWDIARVISEEIKIADEKTVLYIRGLIPSPKLLQVLRKKRRCKVVFELQSFSEIEARQRGSWETYLAMMLLIGKIIRTSDGIVGVTNQITEHYYKKARKPGLAHFTNGNGIDVSSVPMRTPPCFDGRNLELICVAQFANWHGVDRLINGMSSFKNVKLHLVGEGSAIAYLKKLVTEKGLERQVMFHGFKTGEELDEMFNKCHVAVGSLGLHRLGFRESSVLKDKEYCARGIPFIYSLPDADFPGKSRYRFKVPADDTPLDMTAIMAFCRGILKNKNHTMEMREFAFHNLDWKHKMKKLKLYLQTLT